MGKAGEQRTGKSLGQGSKIRSGWFLRREQLWRQEQHLQASATSPVCP